MIGFLDLAVSMIIANCVLSPNSEIVKRKNATRNTSIDTEINPLTIEQKLKTFNLERFKIVSKCILEVMFYTELFGLKKE